MGTKKKKMMKTESEEKETDNSKKNSEILASCSFSSLGLNPILCDLLRAKMGFKAPTTVHAQAIPVILSGRHVLVNVAIGTSKIMAYRVPIIHLL